GKDHPGEVLQVDLVADAGAGRDDDQVPEGLLRPAQQLVALPVAFVLERNVGLKGVRMGEDVGDDRVVDDYLGREQRADFLRIPLQIGYRDTQGDYVDHTRHAGEVR